jgi:hypothetical protein
MVEAGVAPGAVISAWVVPGLALAACALELRAWYLYGPLPFDDVLGPRPLEEAEVLWRRLEGAAPRGQPPVEVIPVAPRLPGRSDATGARPGAYRRAA